jgi:SAM-dependent methyltransferase
LQSEYARKYRDLYTRHWWWRAREDAVLEVLRRHTSQNSRLRILDIGCGDGLFFDRLAEFGDVEGVEPDEGLVNPSGPHRKRIRIAPFDSNFNSPQPYSLILMLDVLEHLDHPGEALRHVSSLLEPHGALLVTVPAFQLLWTNHDVINHHRVRYRRSSLRPLLRKGGFAVVEERYWYQWMWPAKFAVRVFELVFRRPPAIPRVPPDWINRALYGLSRVEQQTLGRIGTPFGSSLMAYCTKRHPQALD